MSDVHPSTATETTPATPVEDMFMPTVPRGSLLAHAASVIEAIVTLRSLENTGDRPTPEQRHILRAWCGWGPIALSIFPDPVKDTYRAPSWQALGEQLKSLLSPEEYAGARKAVFSQFLTPPTIIKTIFTALKHLGVPDNASTLEPGCGPGRFMAQAPDAMQFTAIELETISGRIAQALYPQHDIRLEPFERSHIPDSSIDTVVGNVPFANVRLPHKGSILSLHDFCIARALDTLHPGGILAVLTTHYTLDKMQTDFRQAIGEQADFIGAIRLPREALEEAGTSVITDLLMLQKRTRDDIQSHQREWINSVLMLIEGQDVPINSWFHSHPEMVLGDYTRQDRLYGAETGYSLTSNGDLAAQLQQAILTLPRNIYYGESPPRKPQNVHHSSRPLSTQESSLAEGSFFVDDHHSILQVQHGTAVPVLSNGQPLTADGSLLGQRMAHLIRLRDATRHVLQVQNAGASLAVREDARGTLNAIYDAFVSTYKWINSTLLSTTKAGITVRRMPNLVTFRDDPEAVIVMSLEQYDEDTDVATKAAIFSQDVVGHMQPITTVSSAEQGLLISLDQKGYVDLAYIAQLTGNAVPDIVDDLGDLLYQDPETQAWLTADEYLSGNVRARLTAAEQSGPQYQRNAEALRLVQPEDVLPSDIDANLGAPWIPVSDIHAFAVQLFGLRNFHITIAHSQKEALWHVEGSYWASSTVAATVEYGTSRANGVTLLGQALNMKSPTIYDEFLRDGKEARVLNQEQTLAAREKQTRIKEAFKGWVFSEPGRTERLVRAYNDLFNNVRLRNFDGAHLQFPGMSPDINLYPHQKAAVWRIMSAGNTLLAHVVGSGKTKLMMTAAMKMKQAGLVRKSLMVVPNNLLEQFARECLQLYPNAKLLIATKEDFTQARRKLLTAKMASGVWDGILTTHSSFERIGMSNDFQARYLQEQIDNYESLIVDSERAEQNSRSYDRAHRNIIKALEKQKARYEGKLKALMAEDKKDDGLVFDELGIDYLFYDESQAGKNLTTPTKMERVAGIQTGGSERAFDLAMKCAYLHSLHPGHGVTFASGTPISNTMVEMYTVQRYLDPGGLAAAGLEHFDAWAGMFGEVIEAMEISPDGKTLRPRSRFAKFVNLPELMQMFRSFADVQTAEMLQLPTPRLQGGKATTIACPMSETQHRLQDSLVKRYEDVRNGKVRPWEDNALAITTDGRKLALDARLLLGTAEADPQSKVFALIDNVWGIWQRTTPERSTQLVFADLGVHPTAWGYSVYAEIIDTLIKRGIPKEQVAQIGDATTDAKKHVLFEKVRSGSVRILLGSTTKMGMGTNVQHRLIALHHLDAPWKPAEVEQREGRILRQGNSHAKVMIFRYVTQGSFDAFMWQSLETKARFISQVMTGQSSARTAEDVSEQALSYAEVKAIASGNPAVLTMAETDAALQRLALLAKHHADEQYLSRLRVRDTPRDITSLQERLARLQQDQVTAQGYADSRTPMVLHERPLTDAKAVEALGALLKTLLPVYTQPISIPLGTYRGLSCSMALHPYLPPEVCLNGQAISRVLLDRRSHGPRAILHGLQRIIDNFPLQCASLAQQVTTLTSQLADHTARLGGAFPLADYRAALGGLRDQLSAALSEAPGAELPPLEEIVAAIDALKAAHAGTPMAQPMTSRIAALPAESVTTRIYARQAMAQEQVPGTQEEQLTLLPLLEPILANGAGRRHRRKTTEIMQAQLTLF